jgi:hypothetical protein
MVIDTELYNNINYLFQNYHKVVLNKFDNNYVIYFGNPTETVKNIDTTQLENNLKSVFQTDIHYLLLYSKIKNIPSILNNYNIQRKMENDFNYVDNVKTDIFNFFYMNHTATHTSTHTATHTSTHISTHSIIQSQRSNYEKILKHDISSDNYMVRYNISQQSDKNISISSYQKALNKLSSYNKYLNDLFNNIDLPNLSNQSTQYDKSILLKTIKLDDLFNLNKINDIYNFVRSNNSYNNHQIEFSMNDVGSDYLSLRAIDTNISNNMDNKLSSEQFKNNVIIFLNELIKKKMVKTIRGFNYMVNHEYLN